MRVRVFDARDRVDLVDHQLSQRILMGNLDDGKNIGFAPAGIDLLDLFDRAERFDDIDRSSGMNIDQDIGSIGHG